MRSVSLLCILAIGLISCSSKNNQLYNYADYSESYYSLKKDPNTETKADFHESLEEAIKNAENSRSKRIAPGICANLGYLALNQEKPQQAIQFFKREKMIYPESAHFMDKLIKKVEEDYKMELDQK